MPALVPTLTTALSRADTQFASGRIPSAARRYAEVLDLAQQKTDRGAEVIARSMLAWCALKTRDLDAAQDQLQLAGAQLDPAHLVAHARYRKVRVRWILDTSEARVSSQELLEYLRWAEANQRGAEALDACLLLSRASDVADRVGWLERGIDLAVLGGDSPDLGVAYTELATCLDQLDRSEDALAAYEQALGWHQRAAASSDSDADLRAVVGAAWAVGAAAGRNEAWDRSRDQLEWALAKCTSRTDCMDLQAWIRSDLALAYEAAGDVVGARHQIVRALQLAKEQDLASLWPDRHGVLLAHARRLEVG